MEFVRGQTQTLKLASYDDRLLAAAKAIGITTAAL